MKKMARIHSGKETFRRHHLGEWLAERDMDPMDLVNALNDAAGMDQGIIDKSQVYRWLRGQLPHKKTQLRIAAALRLHNIETDEPDPELLTMRPTQAWIARKIQNRTPEEIERLKNIIDNAFPDRTGTEG